MGQARQQLMALLGEQPMCIFCGGEVLATTRDHQPARALFDRKEWPEGYVFSACEQCNQQSKQAENAMALLVRINSEREEDPRRRAEMQKYIRAMNNNFPGLIKPLTAREKRQFFKAEGKPSPEGGYASFHMAGMQAELAEATIDTVVRKILKALHYKHTGGIVPTERRCVVFQWFTNAFVHLIEDEPYSTFRSLPSRPPLVRNRRDLSEQFGYRYVVGETGEISAYLIKFRLSLIAVGIVVQDPALLPTVADEEQPEPELEA